jgi:hypothetical protein
VSRTVSTALDRTNGSELHSRISMDWLDDIGKHAGALWNDTAKAIGLLVMSACAFLTPFPTQRPDHFVCTRMQNM